MLKLVLLITSPNTVSQEMDEGMQKQQGIFSEIKVSIDFLTYLLK